MVQAQVPAAGAGESVAGLRWRRVQASRRMQAGDRLRHAQRPPCVPAGRSQRPGRHHQARQKLATDRAQRRCYRWLQDGDGESVSGDGLNAAARGEYTRVRAAAAFAPVCCSEV